MIEKMEINLFKAIEEAFKEKYRDWNGGTQFSGSGKRLQRLVDEMCWSRKDVFDDIEKSLQAVFPDSYNEMLICKDINVWTLCPHHLLPCNFKVYIGYIPTGNVLGLSKFARVAVTLGKMPIMQEQYTRELADILWNKLTPNGLGVYVIGKHGCMGCRGINQEISIVTSTLKGAFLDDLKTRGEFYSVCKE
jgi:GTP cyclohydrolase I